MKLNKIKFAAVISYISRQFAISFTDNEIMALDDIIDMEAPEAPVKYADALNVNELMYTMAQGTDKIGAIKLHRALTGYGLKESKEFVEQYWVSKKVENND